MRHRPDPNAVKEAVRIYRIVYRSLAVALSGMMFIITFVLHGHIWGGLFVLAGMFWALATLQAIRQAVNTE